MVALGIASKAAQGAASCGGEHGLHGLEMGGSIVSGVETVISAALVFAQGYRLWSARSELQKLESDLASRQEALNTQAPKPKSFKEEIKETIQSKLEKLSHLAEDLIHRDKHVENTHPKNEEPTIPVIDPEISKLTKKIEKTKEEVRQAAFGVAVGTVMTTAGGVRLGLEITEVAARESFTTAMSIASSSIGLGLGVIGLGLSAKHLYHGISEHNALSKQLKETNNPEKQAYIQEKLTDAKVSITRSSITLAASALGITASSLAVAASVTGVALGTAIAATGFGALALGALALTIGIGYFIYKNREAIAAFLSKLFTKQNVEQLAKVAEDQMKASLSTEVSGALTFTKMEVDKEIIQNAGRSHKTTQPQPTTLELDARALAALQKELKGPTPQATTG